MEDWIVFRFRAGGVAQLVRALPCHGRGYGFEPRHSRHPSPGAWPLIIPSKKRLEMGHVRWEFPRMKTLTVDDRQRIRLPKAKPGEVFPYEPNSDGTIKLVPVIPKPGPRRVVAKLVKREGKEGCFSRSQPDTRLIPQPSARRWPRSVKAVREHVLGYIGSD